MRGKTLRARLCKLYGRVEGRQSDNNWKYSGNYNLYHDAIKAGQEKFGRRNFMIVVDHHRNAYAPTREEQLPIAGAVETHMKRMVAYGLSHSTNTDPDENN